MSVSWQLNDRLSVAGAAYQAERTPTLNELHRGFRAGNVNTNANPFLRPETLTGGEGGILLATAKASVRVTTFLNQLTDAITNVTLSATPALILRERQNTDTVRAIGLEAEADLRLHPSITVSGLVVVTRSTFDEAPAQPALEGNRIPQVPRYQLGSGVAYTNPRTLTLTAQIRAVGSQFDDDQNLLELEPFTIVDAYASRALRRGLQAFLAVENLFDKEYDVGRTPVRSIGFPRTVRGGLRVFLP